MKHQAYYTRALQSKDPRFARIFEKMGYSTTALQADNTVQPVDLSALRDEYEKVLGKRPFNGWDADELNSRIAKARESA